MLWLTSKISSDITKRMTEMSKNNLQALWWKVLHCWSSKLKKKKRLSYSEQKNRPSYEKIWDKKDLNHCRDMLVYNWKEIRLSQWESQKITVTMARASRHCRKRISTGKKHLMKNVLSSLHLKRIYSQERVYKEKHWIKN